MMTTRKNYLNGSVVICLGYLHVSEALPDYCKHICFHLCCLCLHGTFQKLAAGRAMIYLAVATGSWGPFSGLNAWLRQPISQRVFKQNNHLISCFQQIYNSFKFQMITDRPYSDCHPPWRRWLLLTWYFVDPSTIQCGKQEFQTF